MRSLLSAIISRSASVFTRVPRWSSHLTSVYLLLNLQLAVADTPIVLVKNNAMLCCYSMFTIIGGTELYVRGLNKDSRKNGVWVRIFVFSELNICSTSQPTKSTNGKCHWQEQYVCISLQTVIKFVLRSIFTLGHCSCISRLFLWNPLLFIHLLLFQTHVSVLT